MIITWKSLINENSWLNKCIMDSLTNECIESGREKTQYEVKLLVNDIELEPKVLEDLITNVVKYIEKEAVSLADEKLKDVLVRADKLQEIVNEACYKIRDEFNISDTDCNIDD
jgi:hypothetical protein